MITIKFTQDGFKFGVELECVIPEDCEYDFDRSMEEIGMDVSGDGSIDCSDYQEDREVKTQPLTMSNTFRALNKVEEVAKRYKAKVNDSCGLHVHTSHPKFFQPEYLRKVLGVWVAIEDVLFATQPNSRLSNQYCKRRLRDYVTAGFPEMPKAKRDLVNQMGNYDRYYALNVAALQAHGTLECRLHSGSLNAQKIGYWIKLLRAVYEYAFTRYDSKQLNRLMKLQTSRKKIREVWEMLGLDREMRSYYNKRVLDVTLKKLARQQKTANSANKLRVRRLKLNEEYKRVQEALNKVCGDQERILSEW